MCLLTTGEIARRLNVDRDVVSYAIRKLRIKPAGVAGNVRIFSRETLVAVQRFLESKVDSHSNKKRFWEVSDHEEVRKNENSGCSQT